MSLDQIVVQILVNNNQTSIFMALKEVSFTKKLKRKYHKQAKIEF